MSEKLLLLLVVVAAVVVTAYVQTASSQDAVTCPPGHYVVNSSGAFICVPERQELSIPFVSIRVDYNDTGIYLFVVSLDPSGVTGQIQISDPDMNPIQIIDINLQGGEVFEKTITLPSGTSYDFIIVNGTLNNYDIGMYAVPKAESPVIDIGQVSSINERVGFILSLAILSPFIGIAMKGHPREGGLGLIGLGALYTPLMHVLGLRSPIPEFVSALAVITGLIMVATNLER